MADLVMGDDVALLLGQDAALALEPADHAVDRLVEVGHVHGVLALARGEERRLVDDVGEVGARHARGAGGEHVQIDGGRQGDVARVHLEDGLAPLDVGLVHDHLAVEAPRPQQGRVEHLGAVGGGHDDHALGRVEAVHLREELVQRLLALVVAATGSPWRPRGSSRWRRARR